MRVSDAAPARKGVRPGARFHPAAGLLAVLLLACGGCGDDSPTQPDWNGPVVVRVSDPQGELAAERGRILELAAATIDSVRAVHPVQGVTVTIFADAAQAIAGYGIGGRTPNATTVELYLDASRPDLASVVETRLPPLLAHELHHVFRWRGPGYGSTLLEAMVSEGLADRFSIELLGVTTPPWCHALTDAEFADMLTLAAGGFDAPAYDHARWFFGSTGSVPRWTGYTLGYRFVSDYQAVHAGARAIDLVDVPAGAFRPQ